MSGKRNRLSPGICWVPLVCFLFLGACGFKKPAAFNVYGIAEDRVIYSLSREGVSGVLSLSKPKKWDYLFETPLDFPRDSSLELDYTFRVAGGESPFQVVLELEGEASWVLPQDLVFLGNRERPGRIRYALPVNGPSLAKISIAAVLPEGGVFSGKPLNPAAVFELKSLRVVPRWYGFVGQGGASGEPSGNSGSETILSL
ncbi:MAG: hypothetical protein LBT93_00895, partial [Treponema sp.]|nr:hypothetical protein [Treponema sp.]